MDIPTSFLPLDDYLSVLIRLVSAVVLGGVIGIERGGSRHDAGLRTHIIVCLGASSVMVLSELIATRFGHVTDITRLGAQVISGIGFLGVGSIIITGNRVRGITTAAGLWTTACFGLVIGAGFLEVAATIVLLMMFTMYVLRPLTKRIQPGDTVFNVTASISDRKIDDIISDIISHGYDVQSVKTKNDAATLSICTDSRSDRNELIKALIALDGVTGVSET